MAKTVPSARTAARTRTESSRAWFEAMRFSIRSSIHLMGRLSWMAMAATVSSSRKSGILSPKPPPMSGEMTRTWFSERRNLEASRVRVTCAVWAPLMKVSS